ncbi:MAG: L-serine ammonia-lyase, iron-sulfur-dependent, subunit alpha [Lachnospirales bacterium]
MRKFSDLKGIIEYACENNLKISEVALKIQSLELGVDEDVIYQDFKHKYDIMKESIENGLVENSKSVSGLTGGMAYKMLQSYKKGNFSGSFLGKVIYSALSVSEHNACMGCIVAAPTAGSCGIIPACLLTLQEEHGVSERDTIMGLINASAVGYIISRNATVSGAEGGCQAECGSASAMIASGMVEMLGGNPNECGHAVSQSLKMLMGLVCDPVAGLVEEPCVVRNAGSATIAVTAAELSLAGIESIIPVDEVIDAMFQVGKLLPDSLKETAEGGVAITDTGKKLTEEIFGKQS